MNFTEFTLDSLKSYLATKGHKPFVAKQLFDWVYQKLVTDFSQMTNLKKELRELLEKEITLPILSLVKEEHSEETTKYLWKLSDGKLVESVLIRSYDRRTLCVSSQVGCNARCAFCASGQKGLMRNLSRSEIIEQLLLVNQQLKKVDESISHVVFMGMGEPLENYDEVVATIRAISSPEFFHISQRRITVSTVGIVDNIHRLAKEGLKCHLVLSLHAPDQETRKKIIPYARRYALEDVLHAMEEYFYQTKRDITYEYILINEINSELSHAKKLAALLKGKQGTVNLIPYNPVVGRSFTRPSAQKIDTFRRTLEESKISATQRYTKGTDIAAACGQLAMKEENLISLKGEKRSP